MHAEAVARRVRHRINQTLHEMSQRRRQLGVLPASRMDRERLAPERVRHLVGEQPRGVDDDRGGDPLAPGLDLGRHACRVAADEPRRRQDRDVAVPADVGERAHERLGGDDAGRRRPERRVRRRVRLALANERFIHERQLHAVRAPALEKRLELRHLRGAGRDDQFSAAPVRHAVARAELVQPIAPLHAQPRLERSLRIVDARVDHAAVVRARLHAGPRVPLEYADGAS